jgi:small subunit ribosomal protein S17
MARSIVGTVVSDKADKTIVLSVTVRKTHPIYKKQYSRSTKYIAHDENNEARVGDRVEVVETRPISARKHLKLVKIIETAAIPEKDRVENITKNGTKPLIYLLTVRASLDHNILKRVIEKQNIISQII